MNHWHRLGERCECGHVTTPARFYEYDDKTGKDGRTQAQAERAYLDWLASPEKPDYVQPPVLAEVQSAAERDKTQRQRDTARERQQRHRAKA